MHLLFLHAFPLDHTMWDEQLSVAPGRCTAPNLYRFGASLESWAAGVLDSIGTRSVIVIGSSMGGSCAIEMARQAPDQVAGLVLVGTNAGHRPEPDVRDQYIDTLGTAGIKGMWPQIASWFSPSSLPDVIKRAESIALAQSTGDLLNAVRVFHERADLTEIVAQWQKPLLVFCGDADPIVNKQKATALSRLAPNAKLHIMPDCGHFMNMERPDEFNYLLSEFSESVWASQAG